MTDKEYVIATNRVKISMAKDCLQDVISGTEYGVDEEKWRNIIKDLCGIEDKLFKLIKLQEE